MKSTLGIICSVVLAFSSSAAETPLLKLQAVPFTEVQIHDDFWRPRQETNRIASIPVNLENLEKAGNLENFRLAAKGVTNGFIGPVFMDSDVYKAIEAASYSLATHPDPVLESKLEAIIVLIAAAQQPDGYLDTYYIVKEPGHRWTNLRDNHELYCAGHLFEAAVAHYQATGKRTLLDVAIRLANYIDSVFGPPPKRMGYPGHPEIELALMKLGRATGEQRYLNLARFFIESRGSKFFAAEHHTPLAEYDGTYWQDDVPICDHRNIEGHAVRACYLMSGSTDVAAETRDPALLKMINRVWRNTTERNMYVTGGIGPSASNEGFTEDYDLPNLTAYQETCATVALAQWNHRLALLYGDARYADVYERSLYNGVLAGVSHDGTRFFYVNPLASTGGHHRSPWFGCACCPPNAARTIASLGGYAYATGDNALWVNLFIQGAVNTAIDGQKISLGVTTDYPWNGEVTFKVAVEKTAHFALRLRVPGWCDGATVAVNGQTISAPLTERGYFVLTRDWQDGDAVALNLPMPVERIKANPHVKDDVNQFVIQRGPLVYCLEACDQTAPLDSLYIPSDTAFQADMANDLLGGVVVVKGRAEVANDADWSHRLYQAVPPMRQVAFTAIPYYAWDNRKPGTMRVWLPAVPPLPPAGGMETQAKVTLSYTSGNCQPCGINDGLEPKSSGEQPAALCHWWPHKGGTEWAQYTWKRPVTVEGTKVYWFDDTGRGECRLPASWQIEYLDGADWKPVAAAADYAVLKDRWCEVKFQPVTTTALRLVLKMQPGWAAGVHEWRVTEADED